MKRMTVVPQLRCSECWNMCSGFICFMYFFVAWCKEGATVDTPFLFIYYSRIKVFRIFLTMTVGNAVSLCSATSPHVCVPSNVRLWISLPHTITCAAWACATLNSSGSRTGGQLHCHHSLSVVVALNCSYSFIICTFLFLWILFLFQHRSCQYPHKKDDSPPWSRYYISEANYYLVNIIALIHLSLYI
jgi:hypothetical protein